MHELVSYKNHHLSIAIMKRKKKQPFRLTLSFHRDENVYLLKENEKMRQV